MRIASLPEYQWLIAAGHLDEARAVITETRALAAAADNQFTEAHLDFADALLKMAERDRLGAESVAHRALATFARAKARAEVIRTLAEQWIREQPEEGVRLPGDADELRRLPGVGEYTAGAVASIAFGERVPAVDGNVRRVLARIYDIEDPGAAELRRLADALVPADRPGDFNQALMELGATLCTPRSPRCADCPLADGCEARRLGVQLVDRGLVDPDATDHVREDVLTAE